MIFGFYFFFEQKNKINNNNNNCSITSTAIIFSFFHLFNGYMGCVLFKNRPGLRPIC